MPTNKPLAIPIKFFLQKATALEKALSERNYEPLHLVNLRLQTEQVLLMEDFNALLCLERLPNVEKLWYQIETVRKALRYFNGRVLLADEVGLGKTIEAGLLIKEYMLRGLAKKILILTPTSLVSQWVEEMETKFNIIFSTPPRASMLRERFWGETDLIISSINTAKSKKNFANVVKPHYDLVVVDEAHHVKNAATVNWKLVNALQKRFIFLLTATPVQNDLLELYNLITLLRPGHLKTMRDFKKEFVASGDLKKPKNKEALRRLLADVMIRNTRSVVNIGLPKRWAHTFILTPSKEEEGLYNKVTEFVKRHIHHKSGKLDRLTLFTLQKEAGSSPQAVGATLNRLQSRFSDTGHYAEIQEISHYAKTVSSFSKAEKLFKIIQENPREKILVFARYKKTLEFLSSEFAKRHIVFREFHGGMPLKEKDLAIKAFEKDVPLLLSTESGGEGRNLQFCNTVINYDLPWNPLRIEQRIGRIHRFGQKREVFIFNLALKNSVEEYILDILDDKLNMFELVIGEMDMILGHLGKGGQNHDFEDRVMGIWTRQTKEEIQRGFAKLGKELVSAKERYGESKELDRELFEEDYQL